MSSKKRYKLLTTAIVTALDASNPTLRGAVWEPAEVIDVQEAEALAHIGIAKETTETATHETVAERQDGNVRRFPASSTPSARTTARSATRPACRSTRTAPSTIPMPSPKRD